MSRYAMDEGECVAAAVMTGESGERDGLPSCDLCGGGNVFTLDDPLVVVFCKDCNR